MRESFRRLLPWIKDEVWIVASLRESGLEKSSKDVYKDIARSLKRRGLMRPDWPGLDWDADKDVKPCA
jgi:ribonuclease P protein component